MRLLERGAKVSLVDPAAPGGNASSVAAGMLAPAFEAALDPLSGDHFELLKAARDLWPAFAERIGGRIKRCGAFWVGVEGQQVRHQWRLQALGADAEYLPSAIAQRLSVGLYAPAGAVHTPEDWRLEPDQMLRTLETAFARLGGRRRAEAIAAVGADEVTLSGGGRMRAAAVVLATGLAPRDLALDLAVLEQLTPVKGQIARFDGAGPREGPMVRTEGVYVVPSAAGAAAGASMEPGVFDLRIDPKVIGRLAEEAGSVFPGLARAPARGQAGVRSATPDGLPLVGRWGPDGPVLALGARRNGWLLAPMIAETVADALAGKPPGPWTARFAPGRFSPG